MPRLEVDLIIFLLSRLSQIVYLQDPCERNSLETMRRGKMDTPHAVIPFSSPRIFRKWGLALLRRQMLKRGREFLSLVCQVYLLKSISGAHLNMQYTRRKIKTPMLM
jgi:hypothetical protein